MEVHDDDLRLLAQSLHLGQAQLEGIVQGPVHEDAAREVEGRDGHPRALALPHVRSLAGLALGVVERAQQLGDQVDDADDLLLVPDVVPGGQAVDPRVQHLVADLLRDPEAAGRVLHVRDAVVDVVLLEDEGQGPLQDRAARVAHHVADDQDVHRPSSVVSRLGRGQIAPGLEGSLVPAPTGALAVILPGMTHRVGRKGQVVIPKAFREAVSLQPGDEITFSREGNAIRVERVVSPDALMGRLAGHRLVEALEKDRRAERRR